MYSKYQRKIALQLYDQYKSVSKVIQQLGYPTRNRLYGWIAERDSPLTRKASRRKYNNSPDHPRHPSLETKLQTIRRCFELGENVQLVSEEIGYSRASIYTWRKKYILKGAASLMNASDDPRGKLSEGDPSSTKEIEQLNAQKQGKAGMEQDINLLTKQQKLATLTKRLLSEGFDVYITADHGNTYCMGMGQIKGTGVELETKSRRFLVLKDFADKDTVKERYGLLEYPKYDLSKEYDYLICDIGKSLDVSGEEVMSHGGITIDEVVVPFIKIKAVENNG